MGIERILPPSIFQCVVPPYCHLHNQVQMKGKSLWPFTLPFLPSLLLGFKGWLKGVLGSLNLVLASVPPRDKVDFQANFHMKAAENFPPILEFQAAPWALTSQTHSFGPNFLPPPHPNPPLISSHSPFLSHWLAFQFLQHTPVNSTQELLTSRLSEAHSVRKGFIRIWEGQQGGGESPVGWGGREESLLVRVESKKIVNPIANYLEQIQPQ